MDIEERVIFSSLCPVKNPPTEIRININHEQPKWRMKPPSTSHDTRQNGGDLGLTTPICKEPI
ncbi:hypothetical protein I7I50_09818 [Histoplasma capsulatum G186AR]|uniref:Uncharacterized protein n=1 Tax=Ajellomyces capsulatus TaxID=5037 RepID=A0A8H7Z1D8_AJECA|nr:hypothetical protein I7I52_10865 [Histoplasma capsulatum]QSS68748.1 hypothetical protein I7I50_09818 [Histoplasma capsulatum G186AR]